MDNNQEKSEEAIYTPIDVAGLSKYLTEDSFRERTRGIPEDDLFPVQIEDSGSDMKVVKEAASKWAHLWANIYDGWKSLIMEFKRPTHEEDNKEQ